MLATDWSLILFPNSVFTFQPVSASQSVTGTWQSEEETNVATSLSSLSVSVSLSLSGLSLLRGARTWWQSGSGLVLPGSEAVRHDCNTDVARSEADSGLKTGQAGRPAVQ